MFTNNEENVELPLHDAINKKEYSLKIYEFNYISLPNTIKTAKQGSEYKAAFYAKQDKDGNTALHLALLQYPSLTLIGDIVACRMVIEKLIEENPAVLFLKNNNSECPFTLLKDIIDKKDDKSEDLADAYKAVKGKWDNIQQAAVDTEANIDDFFSLLESKKKQSYTMSEFGVDRNGNSLLYLALISGNIELAKALIKRSSTEDFRILMKQNNQKETALNIATENGNNEIVNLILKKQSSQKSEATQTISAGKHNAIQASAIASGVSVFKDLLAKEIKTNRKLDKKEALQTAVEQLDDNENSLLHLAVMNGNNEVATWILKNEKIIQLLPLLKANIQGENPAHIAIKSGNVEIAKLIYQAEFLPFLQSDNKSNSPFHLAATCGIPEMMRFLIEDTNIGAKFINATNSDGHTPLSLAINAGDERTAAVLLTFLIQDDTAWNDVKKQHGGADSLYQLAIKAGAPDLVRAIAAKENLVENPMTVELTERNLLFYTQRAKALDMFDQQIQKMQQSGASPTRFKESNTDKIKAFQTMRGDIKKMEPTEANNANFRFAFGEYLQGNGSAQKAVLEQSRTKLSVVRFFSSMVGKETSSEKFLAEVDKNISAVGKEHRDFERRYEQFSGRK